MILNRLKRLWKLSKKDAESLEAFMKLSDREIMDLPDEDQKAVFFSPGSEQEYKEFENEKKFGVKKIFDL